MIIHYEPNPLKTRIELVGLETELLRLKIKIEFLENRMFDAWHKIRKEHYTMEHIIDSLDIDKGLSDENINATMQLYLNGLNEAHDGDCTCQPCSCLKCHVEEMIDVNTIDDLDKYSASHIRAAFAAADVKTIHVAIEWLMNYEPLMHGTWSGIDLTKYGPRWKLQARTAGKWLTKYRDEHGFC